MVSRKTFYKDLKVLRARTELRETVEAIWVLRENEEIKLFNFQTAQTNFRSEARREAFGGKGAFV